MAEAQRLITVSLGKIAQSKGQRGGASLYRNLLVSTVLHKARHVFMTENFTAMIHARRAQAEKLKDSEEETTEEPSRPLTPAPSVIATASASDNMETDKSDDKENSPPRDADLETTFDVVEDNSEVKDKSCAKCTKRRLSDVHTQNGALCESSSPNKRARHENDSASSDAKSTDDVSTSARQDEAMQTEPISSLVHRFNSGLSGLLGTKLPSIRNENNNNCQTDSIVPFCGTQVTFSESLGSRPAIALTV